MADPLSVVVTLLGTGRQIVKKLVNLRNAPDVIYALQNEINDVCCVIEYIQSTLERCSQEGFTPPASIARAIEKTRTTMLAVECLIAYDLTVPETKVSHVKIDKLGWLRLEPKIQELKNQMRRDRDDLSLGLSLLTSSAGIEAFTQNRRIIAIGEGLDSQIRRIMASLPQQPPIPQLQSLSTEIVTRKANPYASVHQSSLGDSSNENEDLGSDWVSQSRSKTSTNDSSLALKIVSTPSKGCGLDCTCKCHEASAINTPRFLNHILGSLFFGYRSAPWFGQTCNEPLCRNGSIQFYYTYMFPAWFLRRILQFSFAYNHTQGPELILRMMRVRAMYDPPFCYIKVFADPRITFKMVKEAIEIGEASVLDVTLDGRTVLDFAMAGLFFDLIEYLLRKGSDPHFKRSEKYTAYMEAWQYILNNPELPGAQRMSALFDQSGLGSFHFTRLHRAYLGLSGDDFDRVLRSTDRSNIDEKDSYSRTTLSWAAARNDTTTVQKLLACGADPNSPDETGITPLQWVSWYLGDINCPRQLIQANAHVNVRDHKGNTPLLYAVVSNNTDQARLLLEHGADINLGNNTSKSAISFAIHQRRYRVLARLLEVFGPSLFPYGLPDSILLFVAWRADAKTLDILYHYVQYFVIHPAAVEATMDRALAHAYLRVYPSNSEYTKELDTIFDAPFALKDPARWFKAFAKLAFKIYRRSGGKKSFEDLFDPERIVKAWSDQTGDEIGRESVQEQGDARDNHSSGPGSTDETGEDGSESDEEWYDTEEE